MAIVKIIKNNCVGIGLADILFKYELSRSENRAANMAPQSKYILHE